MAINKFQNHTTTGAKDAIMLSRHNDPQYSISIQVNATATYTVQGTISQLNRGQTAIWNDIPELTTQTTDMFEKIENSPMEALRINITALTGTLDFQVAQNT